MARILKYTISTIISLLMACTLFFSVGLYVDFGEKLTDFVTHFTVFLLFLMIIAWIVTAVINKVSPFCGQLVFDEKEVVFWRTVTLFFFFGFTICFGVRSEIADQWVRGSEVYMNAMIPFLIPCLSGLIVEFIGVIGSED